MEKENTLLNELGNETPFTVPENYFETFSRKMEQLVDEQEQTVTVPHLTMWHRVQPYIYLAAMFIGLYVSFNLFLKPSYEANKQEELQLVELAIEQDYILDEIDEYTLYELVSYNN